MQFALLLIFGFGTGILVLAQNLDSEIHYAVIGNPFSLSCIPAESKRPIRACSFQEVSLSANQARHAPNKIIRPPSTDLDNGICNFTIPVIEKDDIKNWKCKIIYKNSADPYRSDLEFSRIVKIVEAVPPGKPKIWRKEKVSVLLANSLVKASDNNNTVNLECCAVGGVPRPTLAFLLDGVPKVELNLTENQNCIKWTRAVFNFDDNGKLVRCQAKHLSILDQNDSRNQDSFILNVLHAPSIIDEDTLDKSPETLIYSFDERTEIRVRITSNPAPKWKWSVYDPRSHVYNTIFSSTEDPRNKDNEHETLFQAEKVKDTYEARLLIRNKDRRNWKRYYALELTNEYGSTWTSFNVTQIVAKGDSGQMRIGNEIVLPVSDSGRGGNSTLSVTCCVRTGIPTSGSGSGAQFYLILGDSWYVDGYVYSDAEDPFCYTWKELQFSPTDHGKTFRCESGNKDMVIMYGDDHKNQGTNSIIVNVIDAPFLIEPDNSTVVHAIPSSQSVARIKFSWHPEGEITWRHWRYRNSDSAYAFEQIYDGEMFRISTVHVQGYTWETVLKIRNKIVSDLFFELTLENQNAKRVLSVEFRVNKTSGITEMLQEPTVASTELSFASTGRTDIDNTSNFHTEIAYSSSITTSNIASIASTDTTITENSTPFFSLPHSTSTRAFDESSIPGLISSEMTSNASPTTTTTFSESPEVLSTTGDTIIDTSQPTSESTTDASTVSYSPSTTTRMGFDETSLPPHDLGEMSSTIHPEFELASEFTSTTERLTYSSLTSTENASSAISTSSETTPRRVYDAISESVSENDDILTSTERITISVSAPRIFENSTGITVGSTTFQKNRLSVKFSATPYEEVIWSGRGPAPSYQYETITNGNKYKTSLKQYLNGTWETALIINPTAWNSGSKLNETKKLFQLNIRNSAGHAKLDVALIVNELKSSMVTKTSSTSAAAVSGEFKQYTMLGILLGGFIVLGLATVLLIVAEKHSLLCFHNRRGSFIVKPNGDAITTSKYYPEKMR